MADMAFLSCCLWIFLQQTSPLRGKDQQAAQYRGGICHMTSSLKGLWVGSREHSPDLPHCPTPPPIPQDEKGLALRHSRHQLLRSESEREGRWAVGSGRAVGDPVVSPQDCSSLPPGAPMGGAIGM